MFHLKYKNISIIIKIINNHWFFTKKSLGFRLLFVYIVCTAFKTIKPFEVKQYYVKCIKQLKPNLL